jgi:hypothetical protein
MKVVLNKCYGGFRLSQAAFRMLDEINAPKEYDEVYLYDNRHDQNLVRVVETLGHKAGSEYSKLEVVEWPDSVPYRIDEYDGMETITIDVTGLLDKHAKEIEEANTWLAGDLLLYRNHINTLRGPKND